jgi:hypothetical protein
MDLIFSVNWYLVGSGTLLGMMVGMLWYSPLLFCNPWLNAMGISKVDIAESGVSQSAAYTTSTFAHALLSFVTGVLVVNLKVHGFQNGMILGFILWLGFNFTSVIKYVFFETRPWALFLIDAGYDIACFTLTGGIFAQWQ